MLRALVPMLDELVVSCLGIKAAEQWPRFRRDIGQRAIWPCKGLHAGEIVQPHDGCKFFIAVGELSAHQVEGVEAGDAARLDGREDLG